MEFTYNMLSSLESTKQDFGTIKASEENYLAFTFLFLVVMSFGALSMICETKVGLTIFAIAIFCLDVGGTAVLIYFATQTNAPVFKDFFKNAINTWQHIFMTVIFYFAIAISLALGFLAYAMIYILHRKRIGF